VAFDFAGRLYFWAHPSQKTAWLGRRIRELQLKRWLGA
jgi:hypothetical protein